MQHGTCIKIILYISLRNFRKKNTLFELMNFTWICIGEVYVSKLDVGLQPSVTFCYTFIRIQN